jgi:lipopolysaccharide transport system permease protein
VASHSTRRASDDGSTATLAPGKAPEPVDSAGDRAHRWAELAQFWELVLHLARREAASRQRFTLLGWAWPLARQLAQLGVLVFVFSRIVRLGIPDFPVFVFSGLIAWTWFSTGLGAAASSVVANRNLVFQARFPVPVLPAVATVVPLLDVAFALPVIALMLALAGELHATFVFLPIVLLVQLVLMSGLAWLVAAAHVYFRDVQNIVGVLLLILFYVTPVFYDRELVPERYEWVLLMNPMTHLIEAYRRIFLTGSLPDATLFGIVAAVSLVVAVVGYAVFRRFERTFVDEL